MDTILLSMLPLLAALVFILYQALRRVQCPDCGELLPVLYSPFRKTRRMWRAGGYLCARCGCETDTAGRKVTADSPLPPFPAGQWALVGVLLVVGLGLGTTYCFVAGRAVAAPPDIAAPPVVVAPQQGPPAVQAP
jgi:DNA-directed RNA polymerase subunit RPC12/RpoP